MTTSTDAVDQKVAGLMNGLPIRRFGLLLAALLPVCAHPALFVYFHNIREAVFSQVFSPILIFFAVGLAAWLIFGLLSATMSKGACIALLFLPVFMNYSLIDDSIRQLVPYWRWWRIAPVFLFLFICLSLTLRVFVKRPEGDDHFTKIAVIIGAVFLALTLFNAASGIYTLAGTPRVDSRPAAANSPQAEEPPAVSTAGNRPNFYFFIFDEYARQDVLRKYTGYDNTPFLQGLERKKFNVSHSSYSSSSQTSISVGNSLQYSVKYKNVAEELVGMNHPALFDVFKKAGYKTYALYPMFHIDKDLMDVELIAATGLTSLSIEKTIVAQSYIAYLDRNVIEDYRADRLHLLKQAADIVAEKTEKPKFLFFHFMGPHAPFVFTENGDSVAYGDMDNYADAKFYTGQLRFLNNKIDALTSTILEKDPQAVVLIQSDHGIRFFEGMKENEKRASLNALYLNGQNVNIEGLAILNTLRLSLQHALGLKLELLMDET